MVHIIDELSEMFVGLIPTAEEFPQGAEMYDEKDVNECNNIANEYIAMLKEDEDKGPLSKATKAS